MKKMASILATTTLMLILSGCGHKPDLVYTGPEISMRETPQVSLDTTAATRPSPVMTDDSQPRIIKTNSISYSSSAPFDFNTSANIPLIVNAAVDNDTALIAKPADNVKKADISPENLTIPCKLFLDKITDTSFPLKWNKVDGTTGYRVYKDGILYADNITECSQDIKFLDLCLNNSYSMQVSSIINGYIESPKSEPLILDTKFKYPEFSVSNLKATSFTLNGLSGIKVFESKLDRLSYRIYKDGMLYADNVTDESKEITGLAPNTSYNMQVSLLYKSCGEIEKSPVLTVTTALAAPLGLKAEDKTETSFTLNWEAVNAATSYKIYIDNKLYAENVPGTSHFITFLSANTVYIMQVVAVNVTGESEKSNPLNVTTILKVPSVPTGLAYERLEECSFRLKWNNINIAKSYKVYKDGNLYDGNVTDLYKDITGLSDYTKCNMQVVAVNDTGESEKSKILSVTTKLSH